MRALIRWLSVKSASQRIEVQSPQYGRKGHIQHLQTATGPQKIQSPLAAPLNAL